MATGGTIMAGDKLDSVMDKLGIQGQGLKSNRVQDGLLGSQSNEQSSSESRPTTATSGEQGENIGSFSMPPEAVGVLETVINMNKALEQQIDTLRMRLTIEAQNHDKERNKISQEKEKVIDKKENEIEQLRDSLVSRDDRIGTLIKESHEKDMRIHNKEREISDLKELVKQTEDYADQLQKKISRVKGEKHKLESDPAHKEQNSEIRKLRQEIVSLKHKVSVVEMELTKTNTVIEQQNIKMKTIEMEKGVLTDKFKEELERASRQMRTEVERMREVMKQQYEEMRNLRQQNVEISSDVRDIKDILLKGTIKPEPDIKPKSEKLDAFKSPRPMQKSPNFGINGPLTSRQASTVTKANSPVRASLPLSLNQTVGFSARGHSGFPPIAKDHAVGKWIPAGAKQSMMHVKSSRDKKK